MVQDVLYLRGSVTYVNMNHESSRLTYKTGRAHDPRVGRISPKLIQYCSSTTII
jgi:hypothetical protein